MDSKRTRRQEVPAAAQELPGERSSSGAGRAVNRPAAAMQLQRAEQALRDSERRFRTLFETMAQGVVYQASDGRIISANPAAEAILGLSLDQMQGRTSIDPRWRAAHEDGADFPGDEHPAMVAIRTGCEVHGVVMGVYHPQDQAYRWILIDAIPQFEEGATTPSGVYATFTDITSRRQAEAARTASEARYRRLAESAPAMIFHYELRPVQGFSYVNSAATAITGYTPEDYYRQPGLGEMLIHPDEHWLYAAKAAQASVPESFAVRARRKDGAEIWLEIHNVCIRDDTGAIVAVEGMVFDITARKRMEIELADSHARLQLALDAARAGVWEWNFRAREAVWSERNYALLGLAPHQLNVSSGAWLDIVHPEDRAVVVAAERNALDGNGEFNIDFRAMWPDGSIHWLNDRGRVIHDADGRPERIVGIKIDITDRRHAAEVLRDQVIFLQSLLAAFPNPVFYKDRFGRFLGCNQAFCEFIGRSEAEIVGRTVEDLYAPELAAHYRESEERLMAHDLHQEYETQVTHADGSRRDVLCRKAVFRDHAGQVAGLLGVFIDLTEHKQTEAQLRQAQKMEAIGVLAGGIAHDFNNLLTPIVGYAEMMLERTELDQREHRYLNNIFMAGLRAKRLVRQLLTFSRPEPNEIGLVDVRQTVGEALLLLRPALPATIKIVTDFDPECGMVLAESTQILQVIMNLATNAFQAIGEEQGVIRIGVYAITESRPQGGAHAEAQQWVRLDMADSGIGMDAATRQRLFDPFFTTKPVGKGTGLGLAVVYGIVQHLGGRIEVASEPGHGSTFSIWLPSSPRLEAEEAVPDGYQACSTGRILVADDEEAVLQVVQILLEEKGYWVTGCRTGHDALAAFAQAPAEYALLITDQVMPDMTGEALAQAVLRTRPNLPVILMTGYSEKAAAWHEMAPQALRLVEKPFSQKTLLGAIIQLLAPAGAVEG